MIAQQSFHACKASISCKIIAKGNFCKMKDIFLLDLDETLLDFQRAERVNFLSTLKSFGIDAGEDVYARYHAINDALWKLLERGGITRERLTVQRFEELCAAFGYRADAAAIATSYYENFQNVCYPFEGAAAFVKALSSRGRVYIVTNGGMSIQKRHIASSGFEEYLAGVFISEEMGINKPDVRFCDYLAAHIEGFDRARAVWMGDSLTSDKLCAERGGIDFILYTKEPPAGYNGPVACNYEQAFKLMQ